MSDQKKAKKGKKGAETKSKRPQLGRPGNSVKIGIVGMPNVGKSTMFNILSNLSVPAENYPFCTIDPSSAKVPVPDERFDWLVSHFNPKKNFDAVLTIHDIAGLVKGANEGKGLGNAFLSNIQAVDAIFHLCRAFKNKEIEHVEGSVDPIRDLEIITNELVLKDLEWVSNKVDALTKIVNRGLDKTKKQELATMTKAKAILEEGKEIRSIQWGIEDIDTLNEMQLLTAKPVIYLVNIRQKDFIAQKNKWLRKIANWVKENSPGSTIIPFSAEFEQHIHDMQDQKEKDAFCTENKVKSMVPKIVTTGYHTLDLIHYFTVGADEVKAWTIRNGDNAKQAAATIHTDFGKHFISANCMTYADFHELKSEAACKKAGKYKSQGRNYIVQDGDILHFLHNAGGGGKKK